MQGMVVGVTENYYYSTVLYCSTSKRSREILKVIFTTKDPTVDGEEERAWYLSLCSVYFLPTFH